MPMSNPDKNPSANPNIANTLIIIKTLYRSFFLILVVECVNLSVFEQVFLGFFFLIEGIVADEV